MKKLTNLQPMFAPHVEAAGWLSEAPLTQQERAEMKELMGYVDAADKLDSQGRARLVHNVLTIGEELRPRLREKLRVHAAQTLQRLGQEKQIGG